MLVRRGLEDAHLVKRPIEQGSAVGWTGSQVDLGIEQFHHVANGDLSERAALAGDDQRAAMQHPARRHGRDACVGITERSQPGVTVGVSRGGHVANEEASGGSAANKLSDGRRTSGSICDQRARSVPRTRST